MLKIRVDRVGDGDLQLLQQRRGGSAHEADVEIFEILAAVDGKRNGREGEKERALLQGVFFVVNFQGGCAAGDQMDVINGAQKRLPQGTGSPDRAQPLVRSDTGVLGICRGPDENAGT